MDWQQILSLSLVAAVVTALSNWLSTWFFTYRPQQKAADYDAVRLAVGLERFAYECASVISDEATWYASQGSAGGLHSKMPALTLPTDITWKHLDLSLMQRVLRLQNDLLRADDIIAFEADYITPEFDSPKEPTEQAGLLGYRAHLLALDLRDKYSVVRAPDHAHPWDYIDQLKCEHDKKVESHRQSIALGKATGELKQSG